MKTIFALIQNRSSTSGRTGWLDVIDWPRSPCRTLPNQITNWIGRLWSRPSRCRRSARLAGIRHIAQHQRCGIAWNEADQDKDRDRHDEQGRHGH